MAETTTATGRPSSTNGNSSGNSRLIRNSTACTERSCRTASPSAPRRAKSGKPHITMEGFIERDGAIAEAGAIGIFEGHGDVGAVLHPGSVVYDAGKQSYTIAGSGENMWFAADAFHFVWKKVSGDVSLAADVNFLGQGKNPHRKAVLMIRQTLDADSAYADVALHGEGLTSLQYREEKGATTHEIQANLSAPRRLQLEKRGDYVYMLLGKSSDPLQAAGGSIRVPIHGTYYVGIGVCSHEKDLVEKAVFTNVALQTPAAISGQPALYSSLETIAIDSTDR